MEYADKGDLSQLIKKQKQKHKASQQTYRNSHQEQIKQYNKSYYENIKHKRERMKLNNKLLID